MAVLLCKSQHDSAPSHFTNISTPLSIAGRRALRSSAIDITPSARCRLSNASNRAFPVAGVTACLEQLADPTLTFSVPVYTIFLFNCSYLGALV
jgi:hypothetical protein